ncbi:hypothetical protein SSOG_09126 [Streptomyces himastatinicus ATCC 53653]|uniref:Uncharacterized protein n=1 Tax=Streptomyces himastatinicus ATCC 53653 TaxID=457427 RepID=D9WWY4_9ACTN|nr:hypothetical protein [Streptomyces himastatinicus]EFL29412.1 hypothetical protein SSOG_09126 [Streptomyces himastatinicus ATCC 53653]
MPVDPAGHTPPPVPPGPDDAADIIHIGARRARTTAPPEHQEPTVGANGQPDPTPEQKLAEIIQGMFLEEHRTLTDPATAEAYDITLRAMLLMVDGATARAGLSEEHHQLLRSLMQQARQVPGIL